MLDSEDVHKVKEVLSQAVGLLDDRNRQIRITDTSEGGWFTCKHYETSAFAVDQEGDEMIRQAEREAVREKTKALRAKRQCGLHIQSKARVRGHPTSPITASILSPSGMCTVISPPLPSREMYEYSEDHAGSTAPTATGGANALSEWLEATPPTSASIQYNTLKLYLNTVKTSVR